MLSMRHHIDCLPLRIGLLWYVTCNARAVSSSGKSARGVSLSVGWPVEIGVLKWVFVVILVI